MVSTEKSLWKFVQNGYEFKNTARIRVVFNDIDHLEEKTGICDCLFATFIKNVCNEQTVPEFNSQFNKT